MTREEWIIGCTAAFERHGYHYRGARDLAIMEFNFRCRDEPLDTSPELPADRWPEPVDAADAAMTEVAAESDCEPAAADREKQP